MMASVVKCRKCVKKFKTGYTLLKHFNVKHPGTQFDGGIFCNEDGECVYGPVPKELEGSACIEEYKNWLAIIVERMNGIFSPTLKGGWQKIDDYRVPKLFFQHLLFKLGNRHMHTIKNRSHFKPPMYNARTISISYKIYDFAELENIIGEQDRIELQKKRAFRHGKEVALESLDDGSHEDAIAVAKRRAGSRFIAGSYDNTPTTLSEIIVSTGEGRSTREVEFTWWPNLYNTNIEYGKLSIRFFVAKTTFSRH